MPDQERPWSGIDADLIVVAAHLPSAADRLAGSGRLIASGLALRGAESVAVGIVNGRPVLVAPPHVDTLVVLLHGVIQPYIDSLSGRGARRPWRRAPLLRKLSSPVGMMELALVREAENGLEPLGGSLGFAALAGAGGFVVVPPESEGVQAGETVDAHGL
jgi:molybdopterin molybdotransferase